MIDPLDLPLRKLLPLCSSGAASYWQPPMDVYRDRSAWICKFDLAGVCLDEVEVLVRDGCLVVSGVRRDRYAAQGLSAYSLEIAYSRFERSVSLPCDIDHAAIESQYQDGMLVVLIRCDAPAR